MGAPLFRPLRCIAQGGWGGSAHYPDPTAQSVSSVLGRDTRVDQDPEPRRRAVLEASQRRGEAPDLEAAGPQMRLRRVTGHGTTRPSLCHIAAGLAPRHGMTGGRCARCAIACTGLSARPRAQHRRASTTSTCTTTSTCIDDSDIDMHRHASTCIDHMHDMHRHASTYAIGD